MDFRRLAKLLLLLAFVISFSSCATLSGFGVGRVQRHTLESNKIPSEFDGLTIAIISDTHYPSKFTHARLCKLIKKIRDIEPQMLLLGGDYVTSPEYIQELIDSISSIKPRYGTYAVMGNHDYKWQGHFEAEMYSSGIVLLKDSIVLIHEGTASIALAGVYNSFKPDTAFSSYITNVSNDLFTMLIAHTPDYIQDTSVNVDAAFAGHTHGGQVSLFGLYAPVTNSKYGMRFSNGINITDTGVPVITTNGVGTSRKKIRFCVPSEILLVTLCRTIK